MKKFVAIFLAVVLAVGVLPTMVGYTDEESASVNVGEWLSLLDSEFGMTYYEQTEPYFENIPADNLYFAVVQTAVEWNVISADENIDVFEAVKADFMAATLVKAAKLTSGGIEIKNADELYCPDAVAIAAGNGIVALTKNGKLDNCKISLEEGKSALAVTKNIWANRTFENDEATVKVADNVRDLADLPSVDGADKYEVQKTITQKEIITFPVTNSTSALVEGDVVVLPASSENPFGAVRKVTEVTATADEVEIECEPAELGEVFEEINLETDFAPDFNTAQITDENGNVLNAADTSASDDFSITDSGLATAADENVMLSLLRDDDTSKLMQCAAYSGKPIEINVAVGDYCIYGKINGSTMDFKVSFVIKGVKVTKTYHFTNFNLSAKADVDLLKSNIKQAYIRVDYDVVDSTKVEGSYSTALAEYGWSKDAKISDFDNAFGTNILSSLQGAADSVASALNNIFKVATIEIPIPNMPIVTISIDISLRINIDGSVELIVETNNSRGYEIINNQGRAIWNTVNKQNTLNLGADCQLTANFNIALKLLMIPIVDAGLETGIGVDTDVSITWFTAKSEPLDTVTADIPIEVAMLLTEGQTYCNVSGDVVVYGILNVSVGQNSPLLKLLGLSRTWSIYNRQNAVIYTYHFEEGNVPDPQETIETQTANETITVITPEAASAVSTAVSETFTANSGDKISLASKGSAWTSSDTAVAVIAGDGTLTAVAAGTAVVTGTDASGNKVSISITVVEPEVSTAKVVVVSAYRVPAAALAI